MANLKNLYPGMIVNVICPYNNKQTLKAEVKQVYTRYAVVWVSNRQGGYSMTIDNQSIVDNPMICLDTEGDGDDEYF